MASSNLIFGYGSLINEESRNKTCSPSQAIPAKLKGFQRGWYFPSLDHKEFKQTAIAITPSQESSCNGVLFQINDEDLSKLDEREAGYKRIKIPKEVLETNHEIPEDMPIWVYSVEEKITATDHRPITQSYVDVILSGCCVFGEDFAHEFIRTTEWWHGVWIDDRESPTYTRGFNGAFAPKADELLSVNLGAALLQQRKQVSKNILLYRNS